MRNVSLIRGSGISPGVWNGNPLQYSYLEKFHGQRSLEGYSPCGCKESDMTKHTQHTFPCDTPCSWLFWNCSLLVSILHLHFIFLWCFHCLVFLMDLGAHHVLWIKYTLMILTVCLEPKFLFWAAVINTQVPTHVSSWMTYRQSKIFKTELVIYHVFLLFPTLMASKPVISPTIPSGHYIPHIQVQNKHAVIVDFSSLL